MLIANPTGDTFTIGRSPECDLRIDDQYVSPRHARVTRDSAGQIWIQDLGSTNGTLVNGVKVYAPTQLRPGDSVQIGRTDIPWSAATT